MSIYTEKGYSNRRDYLEQLALEYDIPVDTVFELADFLGDYEDFDGLVCMIEDMGYTEISK